MATPWWSVFVCVCVCGRVIHLRPPHVPFISVRVFVRRPIAALGMWIGMWPEWRLGEGRPVLLLMREARGVCGDRCRSPIGTSGGGGGHSIGQREAGPL